jgi:hypothetical protein
MMKDIFSDDSLIKNVDECFALGDKYNRSADAICSELLHEVGEDAVQEIYASFDWSAIDENNQKNQPPLTAGEALPLNLSNQAALEFHSRAAEILAKIDSLIDWSRKLSTEANTIKSGPKCENLVLSELSDFYRNLEALCNLKMSWESAALPSLLVANVGRLEAPDIRKLEISSYELLHGLNKIRHCIYHASDSEALYRVDLNNSGRKLVGHVGKIGSNDKLYVRHGMCVVGSYPWLSYSCENAELHEVIERTLLSSHNSLESRYEPHFNSYDPDKVACRYGLFSIHHLDE